MTQPNAGLPPSPYTKLLFCTDFSENALHAFRFATDMALRRPDCHLHLLHVIPEPEAQFWKTYIYEVENVDEKAKRDIDEAIARDYRPLVPEHATFHVAMRIGKDYARILEYAEEQAVDLIVLGRHGHSAFGKFLFGNVAEKVVRHAPCPVLVVPLEFRPENRA